MDKNRIRLEPPIQVGLEYRILIRLSYEKLNKVIIGLFLYDTTI